jgi:hypothetical protein
MSSIALQGNAGGTGVFTLASPSSSSNYTLTLPAVTGTLVTTASPGTVLQVVSTTKTDTFTTTSTSFVDITGLSVSITPSSATSKILVFVSVNGSQQYTVNRTSLRLLRDSTTVDAGTAVGSRQAAFGGFSTSDSTIPSGTVSGNYLDSPATTSSITYKMQVNVTAGSGTAYIYRTQSYRVEAGHIRMPSNITVMEIAA